MTRKDPMTSDGPIADDELQQQASAEFVEGLGIDRLQPTQIVSFLQGLHRRLDERLEPLRAAAEHADPGSDRANQIAEELDEARASMESMVDVMEDRIQRVEAAGYRLDTDVADYSSTSNDPDDGPGRVSAAAIEFARGVSGIPNDAWSEHPGLLDDVRNGVATVAAELRTIGTT